MKIPTVLDLFSGCGGLSYGFEMAGFDITAGIDQCSDALNTFKKNHKKAQVYNMDLIKPDVRKLKKELGGIDVVIGGPPCQGFSISGPRNPNDPRNDLYKGFVQVVKSFKPKAFLLENVPNLISMNDGAIKDKILQDFESLGYKVAVKVLLASDYGVPQNRRRVVFIGLRNGQEYEFPKTTHHENKKITTSMAISDLPDFDLVDGSKTPFDPSNSYQRKMRTKSGVIFNHQLTSHTEKTKSIISLVPDGGNYKNLPSKYKDTRKVNIAWTRFHSNKPSLTIDTGHRHHFHYKYNRVPTVRESARLQSFPDHFVFYGSKTSQYKQVGNAVPPLLAYALAKKLKTYLDR